ncbi:MULTISPECIES: FAD-dependent oxidoreductase [unclassified Mesorhizobium]|uniref:NAD(P)/FAD-dependent oxidoreductase n=2 Tax=Mesorhizobium TaxID=68287 RepID=UPI000FC9D6FA|nr:MULTISPECIES: FAD-dependent oxidoreductase [unclassified Mesorhizobium]RUU91712.1 FAD-binding oxidoreductase [Mesorhizobium sp. M7A.F.Ca.MR.176.00.0.0]RVD66844.1 FAD-binding oxidoreductase [Mesorhizobium sp. M7A.F.Ca.ET.027.03.2.1]RWO87956.1 MAG: FAD-binding oxidoreductase [Mesorhizobium sp.]RWP05931.1 MAG: FAD-binding oxidoreductase [Mesorhizobium sp.]RWP87543.1 MAG: FAD-binding oxidoreductase [Mesorhizobium sp.]
MGIPPYKAPSRNAYDIVIVGGAVVGSSTAYWLSQALGSGASILVVERDSSYEFSSTALSTSAIRQQYSNPINVKISQFGIEIIRGFQERMAPFYKDEPAPDLGFKEHGYLYCCSPDGVEAARERVDLQRSFGAHTVFLEPGPLKDRFPWLNVEDLGGGSWGAREEGWFDSVGLMNGFRRAARASGVEYIDNAATGLDIADGRVISVRLATGQTVRCGTLVNAAGPRAQQVAAMAGLSIPVAPYKRYSFVFASANPIPGRMPNVIDLSGTFVRPEGELFLTGNTPQGDGPAGYDDFEMHHEEFDDHIWPALWHRIPSFDALKVQTSWTGHYEYNMLDHNGIVGFHPQVTNFMFANGFSGHGLQQSPAVGRGVSELIVHGAFQTLDLSPFCYERIERNEPFLEEAVI